MNPILNHLGLCAKANGLISGEENVVNGIRFGSVCYVFLANDASATSKKRIRDKSDYYRVEVNESYSSEELSHAIGKQNRMAIGITNRNFLKILKK